MASWDQPRYQLVMDTFVELADTLASDYDIADFLAFLLDRCGDLLETDTAGVLLEGPGGTLQLAAAMTEEMERIERVEIDQDDGPCMQAYRTSQQVLAEDLTQCLQRWPTVVPSLLHMGMRAGYAFPLRLRDDCIGALNIYRRVPGRFDEDHIRLAQALADVAAIGILQERKVAEAEQRSAQLQHALSSRIIIEQAKGVLAQRHGVTPREAFEDLRSYARANRLQLSELAESVVEGVSGEIPRS